MNNDEKQKYIDLIEKLQMEALNDEIRADDLSNEARILRLDVQTKRETVEQYKAMLEQAQ